MFVVFQIPLVAPAMKNVPVPGIPSMSVTRPAMFAGPMERHSISAMKSSSATASWAVAEAGRMIVAKTTGRKARFSMIRGS